MTLWIVNYEDAFSRAAADESAIVKQKLCASREVAVATARSWAQDLGLVEQAGSEVWFDEEEQSSTITINEIEAP